jgi:hypothetical protein
VSTEINQHTSEVKNKLFKSQLKINHTASIFVQSSRSNCKFFGVTNELELALSSNTEPSSVYSAVVNTCMAEFRPLELPADDDIAVEFCPRNKANNFQ